MLIFSCVGVRESLSCWEVFTIFQWSRIILSTMVAISHMWLLKFTFKLIKTKNSVPNPHKITSSFSRGSLEAVSKTRMPLTLSNWSSQCWLTYFSLNLFVPGCHHGGEEVLWGRRWGEAQGRALNEGDILELPFGSHCLTTDVWVAYWQLTLAFTPCPFNVISKEGVTVGGYARVSPCSPCFSLSSCPLHSVELKIFYLALQEVQTFL